MPADHDCHGDEDMIAQEQQRLQDARELDDATDWVANGFDGHVVGTAQKWNACDPEPELAPVAWDGRDEIPTLEPITVMPVALNPEAWK
jgi:hypothetical protein